jgi:HK97 family phage portal protein
MGIREFMAEKRRNRVLKAAVAEGLTVPSMPYLKRGQLTALRRGDYTLRNSELIFSAVSRIANSLSSMPVQLYKGPMPVQNRLNDLVSFAPNPNMTSCQFFKTMEACRCTYGNCYGLKVYDELGVLDRIDVLDPSRVSPILDEDSGELWFRVTPERAASFYIHNFYVIHVPFISTNGYSGVNPISVLQDTLDYGKSIQKFSVKQLEQGVNAAVVLSAPANLGNEQRKRMIADFMDTYKKTSGNILLLESGVTAKSLDMSPVDSKLFEVEKITRSKVAMVYNIPPHLLGDYSDTSFNSQEQQMLEFLMLTMLPIVTAYEQELGKKLLTGDLREQGYSFKFNMDSVLRADAATQAEVDYKAVRSACKTVDEIRAARNLPPLPDGIGSKAVISQDMATLEYTVNEKPKVLASKLAGNTGSRGDGSNGEN